MPPMCVVPNAVVEAPLAHDEVQFDPLRDGGRQRVGLEELVSLKKAPVDLFGTTNVVRSELLMLLLEVLSDRVPERLNGELRLPIGR